MRVCVIAQVKEPLEQVLGFPMILLNSYALAPGEKLVDGYELDRVVVFDDPTPIDELLTAYPIMKGVHQRLFFSQNAS